MRFAHARNGMALRPAKRKRKVPKGQMGVQVEKLTINAMAEVHRGLDVIRGREDVSPRELLEVHRSFYQRRIPPDRYRRFVQIPLAPGRRPRPLGEMEKDG